MLCGSLRLITRLPANPSVHASVCVRACVCVCVRVCETNTVSMVVLLLFQLRRRRFCALFMPDSASPEIFQRPVYWHILTAAPLRWEREAKKSPIRRPDDDKEPGFPVTNHPLWFLSFLWAVNGGDDGQIAQLSHWICVGGR